MPGFAHDFVHDSPAAACDALCASLAPVGTEAIAAADAWGRVLAEPLTLDRDSPACDLSAMDGYALRLADYVPGAVPVRGEAAAGTAPPPCPPGTAVRIFTGAPLPAGCDLVVRREDVRETAGAIELPDPLPAVRPGRNVRRRGENGRAGETWAEPGATVTAALLAAAAACGTVGLTARRAVRVAVLVTGDEVVAPHARPEPWQVRDANGAALAGLLRDRPYLDLSPVRTSHDDPAALADRLAGLIETHDAVLLTGGVSVGDRDHVPAAVRACGGRVLFHGLPVRPGKPILAATAATAGRATAGRGTAGRGAGRTALLGLPGNPVAALLAARRFALPALRTLAGFADADPRVRMRTVAGQDESSPLTRFLPVRLKAGGAEVIETRGSADSVALALSDGFVELPPHAAPPGAFPFRAW